MKEFLVSMCLCVALGGCWSTGQRYSAAQGQAFTHEKISQEKIDTYTQEQWENFRKKHAQHP